MVSLTLLCNSVLSWQQDSKQHPIKLVTNNNTPCVVANKYLCKQVYFTQFLLKNKTIFGKLLTNYSKF